jgi:ubiquinone/menaquinone biosynthesis C-methylase UbiE
MVVVARRAVPAEARHAWIQIRHQLGGTFMEQDNAFAARRSDAWLAQMAGRGADYLTFLLPHLRPGMRALDCGCGPGAITIAMASIIRPGEATGVDISESSIRMAQERAAREPVTNVTFEVGSAYHLRFPDRSFDAIVMITVLEHLAEPVAALHEMHRVIKPGGVIGVVDADWDGGLLAPQTPLLLDSMKLLRAFHEREGGSQGIGKNLRRLLRQSGFSRAEVTAGYATYGATQSVYQIGTVMATMLTETRMVEGMMGMGLADRPTLEAMANAWLTWREDPDAVLGNPFCTALAWAE